MLSRSMGTTNFSLSLHFPCLDSSTCSSSFILSWQAEGRRDTTPHHSAAPQAHPGAYGDRAGAMNAAEFFFVDSTNPAAT
jgi:hypothetical protein